MSEPDVSVRIAVARPALDVWRAVADPLRIATWSPEARSASGVHGDPLGVGATFTGSNRHGVLRWTTSCVVVESVEGRSFAFDVTFLGLSVARWRYGIEDGPGGCEVVEQWWDKRDALMKVLGILGTGVADREAHNTKTMKGTLAALKAELEAEPA